MRYAGVITIAALFMLGGAPTYPAAPQRELRIELQDGMGLSAADFKTSLEGVVAAGTTELPRRSELIRIEHGRIAARIEVPEVYLNRLQVLGRKNDKSDLRLFGCGSVGSREYGQYFCQLYRWSEDGSTTIEWSSERLPARFFGEDAWTIASSNGELWGSLAFQGATSVRLIVGHFPETNSFMDFTLERDMRSLPPTASTDYPSFVFLDEDPEHLTVAIHWGGFVDVLGTGKPSQRALIPPTGRGDEGRLAWSPANRILWAARGMNVEGYRIPRDLPASAQAPQLARVFDVRADEFAVTDDGALNVLVLGRDEPTPSFRTRRVRVVQNSLEKGPDTRISRSDGMGRHITTGGVVVVQHESQVGDRLSAEVIVYPIE